jgi:hypothetical protein
MVTSHKSLEERTVIEVRSALMDALISTDPLRVVSPEGLPERIVELRVSLIRKISDAHAVAQLLETEYAREHLRRR